MSQHVSYKRWVEAIKSFEKSDYKDWFKFAMLWFSFNSYYSEKYSHIGGEKNQVIKFVKDNKALYQSLLSDKQVDFKNVLEKFTETKSPSQREYVEDMRPNNKRSAKFNYKNNSCEDFFNVLYQIRCNFFHGDKESSSVEDKKLIQWAFKYFWIFWERFLEENENKI